MPMLLLRSLMIASCLLAPFDFASADEPTASEAFAAIEIGGSGVKSVCANAICFGDLVTVRDVVESKGGNLSLAIGLGASGRFDPAAIDKAVATVAVLQQKLTTDDGVPPDNIAVVGSSGIAHAKNRDALVESIRKETGIAMDFISTEDEVRLTLVGVVPPDQRQFYTLVDVGSANSKWGYFDASSPQDKPMFITSELRVGTKSLDGIIRERIGEDAAYDDYRKEAETERQRIASGFSSRNVHAPDGNKFVLSGGAFWAFVSLVKPGTINSNHVQLTAKDFKDLESRLSASEADMWEVDFASISEDAIRDAAEDELSTVKKVFGSRQLISGWQIVAALADHFQWRDDDIKVFFARKGYKAWIHGYLLEFATRESKRLVTN